MLASPLTRRRLLNISFFSCVKINHPFGNEFLATVTMRNTVFWDLALRCLEGVYRCFEGMICPYVQDGIVNQANNKLDIVTKLRVSCWFLVYSSTLYRTKRRYIP